MGGFFFFFVSRMSDLDKLHDICKKTYKEQAVWFLNCFWEDFAEKEAETLWKYVETNEKLDLENHEEGCGLDEMKAHVFLEKFDETLTVREMRAKLRSTGAIGESERPKLVPLTHYLLYKYDAAWHVLVDETRQGDNEEEMEKAEKLLEEVMAAFKESEARASDARNALNAAISAENQAKEREAEAVEAENQAKAREADAVAKEEEAKKAEAPFKVAQDELLAALAEVKKQEEEYAAKIADCEERSRSGGVVQANKAKNELAQLKAEDPLPLRRAKITSEAAEKRAAKARAPFEAATKIATEARDVATKARQEAEQARAEATAAREAAEQARAAATAAREAAEQARAAATAAREEANKQREAAEQARQASEQAKEAAEKALNE